MVSTPHYLLRQMCDALGLTDDMFFSILRLENDGKNQTSLADFDDVLQDLLHRVGISRYVVRFIPDPNRSDRKYEDLEPVVKRLLCGIFGKLMEEVSKLLFPCDPEGLKQDMCEGETDRNLMKAIAEATKKCKQRSVERRILYAALAGNLKGPTIYDLVHGNDNDCLKLGKDNATNSDRFERSKLERQLKRMNNSDGRNTDIVLEDMDEEPDRGDVEDRANLEMVGTKRRRVNGGFQRLLSAARKDWKTICTDGSISIVPISRICISDSYVKDVIRYIFREDHVQFLSWGTRRLRHNGELKIFPDILRKVSKETIWNNFVREVLSGNVQVDNSSGDGSNGNEEAECNVVERSDNGRSCRRSRSQIGRTTFLALVGTFTKKQEHRRGCIDYMVDTLIHCNFDNVEKLIKMEVSDVAHRDKLLKQIPYIKEYLKYFFYTHIGMDDDYFHNFEHSIHKVQLTDGPRKAECEECKKPFQFLRNVKKCIPTDKKDALEAVEDAIKRVHIFLGHEHRRAVQDRRIKGVFDEMKKGAPESHAIIVMDYKMKLEPVRWRGSMATFFGQRGMSWHGSVLFYRTGEEEQTKDPRTGELKENVSAMYMDHVCSNGRTQDRLAICSILEAVVFRALKEIPELKYVHLITDNANCYQNDLLVVVAPFITKAYGLELLGILHPASQCGKSHADAHFAIAMRHIYKYVEEEKTDVYCPSHVVTALSYRGGIANSVAELYSINRSSDGIRAMLDALKEKRICRMGRLSEVSYEMRGEDIYAKAYEYSGGKFIEYILSPNYTCRRRKAQDIVRTTPGVQNDPNRVNSACANRFDEGIDQVDLENGNGMDGRNDLRCNALCNDITDGDGEVAVGEVAEENIVAGRCSSGSGGTSALSENGDGVPTAEIGEDSEADVDDDIMSSTMTCRHVGKKTGVKLWLDGPIRWIRRSRRAVLEEPIYDVFDNPHCEGYTEEGDYYTQGSGNSANVPVVYSCPRCKRQFSRLHPYERHVEECDGMKGPSTIDRAIGFSFDMISTGELVTYERGRKHPKLQDISVEEDVLGDLKFDIGWARRPKQGETLGKNTADRFMTDIVKWFLQGNVDKGKKMSGAQMKSALELKYPTRYDLPTEQHVTNAINALNVASKKKGTLPTVEQTAANNSKGSDIERGEANKSTGSDGSTVKTADGAETNNPVPLYERQFAIPRVGRTIMEGKYRSVLEKIVEDDPNIKPMKGVEEFLRHFGLKDVNELGSGWPTPTQLKSKISRLKALRKKD